MKVTAKSLAKILACVLSLAMVFSVMAIATVSVSAEDTLVLDWSAKSNYSAPASTLVGKDDNGIQFSYTGTNTPELVSAWSVNISGASGFKFVLKGTGQIRLQVEGKGTLVYTATEEGVECIYDFTENKVTSTPVGFKIWPNACDFSGYVGDFYTYVTEPENEVTIDGVKQTYSGDTFTFPTSTANGFIAYTDGTNYYDAGDSVAITEDIAFTTVAIGAVTMKEGAAIRLGTVSGFRFYTTVDTDKLAALPSDAVVEKGTLIAPKDKVTTDLTFDMAETDYIDVKYPATDYYETATFVGSIVGIREANVAREFIGRGYVKVTVGDVTKTVYATYYNSKVDNNTRAIATIAYNYKNDANSDYSTLSDEFKAIVDNWASKYVEPDTGIDLSKAVACGGAVLTKTDEGFSYYISVNQAVGVAITDYVKLAVDGLEEGVIKGYKEAGTIYLGDKGAHIGVEIDGKIYWNNNYTDTTVFNSATEVEYSLINKTFYEIDMSTGYTSGGAYVSSKKITSADLENITAVYFGNRYGKGGTKMNITSVK